jgi:hypothetical protein
MCFLYLQSGRFLVLVATGWHHLLVDQHQFLDEFQAHHFILLTTVSDGHNNLDKPTRKINCELCKNCCSYFTWQNTLRPFR